MKKNIFVFWAIMVAGTTLSYADFELMSDVDFFTLRYEFQHNVNIHHTPMSCEDVANKAQIYASLEIPFFYNFSTTPSEARERKLKERIDDYSNDAKKDKTTYDRLNTKLSISIVKATYNYLLTDNIADVPKKVRDAVYVSCKKSDVQS